MSARDRFNQTREAVIEHHRICLEIMACGEDWKPEEVRVPKGDPTCTKALHLLDWSDKLATLEARKDELEEFIGLTLAIIEGVRVGLGEEYADVLDARYIDCMTWRDMGVNKSTGKHRVSVACDWVDSLGVAKILAGDYEI